MLRMKKPMIYVDMDGVLTNLDKHWQAMFGQGLDVRVEGRWEQFVDEAGFEELEPMPGSGHLVMGLDILYRTWDIDICVLTAAGGPGTMASVAQQKVQWLANQCIDYGPIVVPWSEYKQIFGHDQAFLIDDMERNCDQFRRAGGHAVQHSHTSVNYSLSCATLFCEQKAKRRHGT